PVPAATSSWNWRRPPHRGYLLTGGTTLVRPGWVEVVDGTLLSRLSAVVRCDSHLACVLSTAAAGSGSRGVCPARSSAALLADHDRLGSRKAACQTSSSGWIRTSIRPLSRSSMLGNG